MPESMNILVTGGAGYIGSHTVIELIAAGHQVVVMDNLCNSCLECLRRVESITGEKIPFYEVDMCDMEGLRSIFQKHQFNCVIHFAGLKAVGESCEKPLLYYSNNLTGTMNLLHVMEEHGVRQIVFSSSATVYGDPQYLPLDEKHPVGGCTNPYGKTKYFIEEMLKDQCKANPLWKAVLLRYFNPVGSHPSGSIGEDPAGPPNNLMPYVAQVAVGRRPHLNVFGSDYDTPDGTGVRDYIHVVDLAQGHVASLRALPTMQGWKVYNLGTGNGYSVLEMVKALEEASGKQIQYKLAPRREGDVASVWADCSLSKNELQWQADRGLKIMCEDLWRWQSNNPMGFNDMSKKSD